MAVPDPNLVYALCAVRTHPAQRFLSAVSRTLSCALKILTSSTASGNQISRIEHAGERIMRSELLRRLCLGFAQHVMASRPPDFVVGPANDPYLLRWRLLRKGWWPNVYVHHFARSDDARALHDHPTDNVSLIL